MRVTYIDSMGTDLSVVNAARVSFGKESEWDYSSCPNPNGMPPEIVEEYRKLSKGDKGLIQFLARGCTSGDWDALIWSIFDCGGNIDFKEEMTELVNHIRRMPPHWTPFAHTAISLHIKAPLFVTRQINKHQVGFVINEVSRRYVTDTPEFYVPETWRKSAENVKQGSSNERAEEYYRQEGSINTDKDCLERYKRMLKYGVCPEQARMVLPQSMYTEFYMTGNLYGWANLFYQRSDSHAQKEVRVLAAQIGEIIKPLYPESWKELTQ